MPFTFSHPAIVLQLISKYKNLFSSTGLIIGSIIPDFESFIKFDEYKEYSHTWLGVFWYDLPLAILFSLIFHNIIRNDFILNLPDSIGSKYYSYIGYNWNNYFLKHIWKILFSIIIGILSHLLWDSFTHLSLVNPNYVLSDIYIFNVKLFIFLQYSNSLLGLLVVIWDVFRKDKKSKDQIENVKLKNNNFLFKSRMEKIRYWVLCCIITFLVFTIALYLVPGPINIVLLIDVFISGVIISLILTPVILKVVHKFVI